MKCVRIDRWTHRQTETGSVPIFPDSAIAEQGIIWRNQGIHVITICQLGGMTDRQMDGRIDGLTDRTFSYIHRFCLSGAGNKNAVVVEP